MKNMPLYKKYAETSPLGTLHLNNWGGLEILEIEYSIDDYAIASFNFGTRQQIRRHKICYTPAGRAYIRKQGRRYYFDEIMRRW